MKLWCFHFCKVWAHCALYTKRGGGDDLSNGRKTASSCFHFFRISLHVVAVLSPLLSAVKDYIVVESQWNLFQHLKKKFHQNFALNLLIKRDSRKMNLIFFGHVKKWILFFSHCAYVTQSRQKTRNRSSAQSLTMSLWQLILFVRLRT